ncbi:hypothetical protein IE81DRAFT_274353, partial [Ceraceosorus guamensis]
SKLGTKAHWDECYERELANWRECEEEGEIWFGQQAARRMVLQLKQLHLGSPTILDLGTGNGMLLHDVLEEELTEPEKLMGVDYSAGSVELARSIAQERRRGLERVRWQVLDLVSDEQSVGACGQWDVLLDKGTLDAIALSTHSEAAITAYVRSTRKLRSPAGVLILTSCNFTLQELERLFTQDQSIGDEDEVVESNVAAPPTFSFGGRTGST